MSAASAVLTATFTFWQPLLAGWLGQWPGTQPKVGASTRKVSESSQNRVKNFTLLNLAALFGLLSEPMAKPAS